MDLLTNLSLFSGAGGLDLGAKLVGGFRTVAYVEYDRYAQGVLMSRMRSGELDDAPIFEDVRTFDGRRIRGSVDVISGGFPCQDISVAGNRAGIVEGNRSGLWHQFARLIRETRPRFVLAENVGGLLSIDNVGGFGTVLRDLASLGYDAEWFVFSAADVGAPHKRERVWIVAHAVSESGQIGRDDSSNAGEGRSGRDNARGSGANDRRESDSRQNDGMAHTGGARLPRPRVGGRVSPPKGERTSAGIERRSDVENSEGNGRLERGAERARQQRRTSPVGPSGAMADSNSIAGSQAGPSTRPVGSQWDAWNDARWGTGTDQPGTDWWTSEPNVGRVAHGVAFRVDRLRCTGNGVVPQSSAKAWQKIKDMAEYQRVKGEK